MYRLNRAKFASNLDCQKELVATGTKKITHPDKNPYWSEWNANVMMRIREELKPPHEQNKELLDELVGKFKKEIIDNGGRPEQGLPALVDFQNPALLATSANGQQGGSKSPGPNSK